MYVFLAWSFCRIQPLNGIISSVTQVVPEEPLTISAGSVRPTPEETPTSREDLLSRDDADDSKLSVSSPEVAKGGMFAGIGHFPPTPKAESESYSYPSFRYKADAALRWGNNDVATNMHGHIPIIKLQ